jgi:MFS superfamily sulfate permease-like transporter
LGEGDGEGVFLVVEDFFVVLVVVFLAPVSFFVVAAVVLVVVVASFLLAHDVIKPTTARSAMDVIRDCFISVVNERPECPSAQTSASIN